jgi:hypothetical protein
LTPARWAANCRNAQKSTGPRNTSLMRRMQDSNFREVRRVTNLLLKIKRHRRKMEALENTAALHYVRETK